MLAASNRKAVDRCFVPDTLSVIHNPCTGWSISNGWLLVGDVTVK